MYLVNRGMYPLAMSLACLAGLAGCGSGSDPQTPDAASDGPLPDAVPSCVPLVALAGGSDVAAQGWTVASLAPSSLTYGADYTRIETTTTTGARTGGAMLLHRADLIETDKPFAIEIEMLVESAGRHNEGDAGVAILGDYSPLFGMPGEREKMVYIDPTGVGFADNSQSKAMNVIDGAYHTFVLSRDAAGVMHFSVDGTEALMKTAYTSNNRFALGDQTNDPNLDGVIRVRKITKLCL